MNAADVYRNPRCVGASRRLNPYQPVSRRARAPGGDGDATRVDNEARGLMDRMSQLSSQLRSDCGSFNFLGDTASCANSADEIDAWLADRGPRLLAQSEQGADDAHQRLVDFAHKMLNFLRTAYDDISAGDTFTDLAGAIATDAGKAARKAAGLALPVGAVAAALAGLFFVSKIAGGRS